MNKKNILFIGNFHSHIGTYNICEYLSKQFISAGYIVYSASKYKHWFFRVLDMILKAYLYRKKYHYICIDVFSGRAFYWAYCIARFATIFNKQYILVLRGGNLPIFIDSNYKYFKIIANKAKHIIAPSQYLIEKTLKEFPISIIPNGIEEKYMFKLRKEAKPHLIWLRAFHHIYNPIMAIKVLKKLQKIYPNINLTIIGPDKNDGSFLEVKNFIKENNLFDNVKMVGPIDKKIVPEYLSKSDIFLNTTNVDNNPVSVIEAMASGLCIVSTNVGGIPYLLSHNLNSFLVNKNDIDGMTERVISIIENPKIAKKLSQNAYNSSKKFSWQQIYPLWEKLFKS